MAQQGWYPDPGGQAGMFRYWDGTTWSEVVSPTPLAGPPSQYGAGPSTPQASVNPGGGTYPLQEMKPKKNVGMWITIIVGVLVLALVVWFVATRVFGVGGTDGGENPVGNPTDMLCPQPADANVRMDHPTDGRVYGGDLSYPKLGAPWSSVSVGDSLASMLPFGRDVADQEILVHENTNPKTVNLWGAWVVSVIVGELYAGDGFYDPEQGSEIVNKCIFGTFYGPQTLVTADTQRSEAYTIDGYDGWITETNLSFSIPDLATTSELAIVIIVKTSAMSSSIFYASIPNDAMQYKADVDNAIANLHVTV